VINGEDTTCIVDEISNYILLKRVRYVASHDGFVRWQLLAGGHDLCLKDFELRIRAGEGFCLWQPFWKQYHIGDSAMLSEIARHPNAPSRRLRQ